MISYYIWFGVEILLIKSKKIIVNGFEENDKNDIYYIN